MALSPASSSLSIFRSDVTKNRNDTPKIVNRLFVCLSTIKTNNFPSELIFMIIDYIDLTELAHFKLSEKLSIYRISIDSGLVEKNVLALSHQEIDLKVWQLQREISLIESFQGHNKTLNTLYENARSIRSTIQQNRKRCSTPPPLDLP